MATQSKKIRLIVLGPKGRMGARILALAQNDPRFELIASIGKESLQLLPKALSKADVVIDFTSVESVLKTAALVAKYKKALIIGTTGLSPSQLSALRKIARRTPIVFSPNMSLGVNLLFQLLKQAASTIPHYDIEIVEAHHNLKKDAPSGTAMKLAEVAAEASKRSPNHFVYGRRGQVGARTKKEIGIMSLRAGDIVGDHTVYFSNTGERLELIHRAHSRDTFAAGALTAAAWLVGRRAGFYSMSDVLGFK